MEDLDHQRCIDIRPEGRTRDEERVRLEALGATMLRLVDDNPDDIQYIMSDGSVHILW